MLSWRFQFLLGTYLLKGQVNIRSTFGCPLTIQVWKNYFSKQMLYLRRFKISSIMEVSPNYPSVISITG